MDIKIDLDEKIKELINKTVSNISSVEKVQAGVKANATYEDGTSMHEVALKNEFGGTTTDENGKNHIIPPRPSFRNAKKQNLRKWFKIFINEAKKNQTPQNIAKEVGATMQADIVKSINSNTPPPNAKMTIEAYKEKYKKGKKKTLIFSGEMVQNIDFEIFIKNKE